MSTLGTLATTHTVLDDKGLVRLISDQDGYAQIENEVGKIFALKDNVGKAYAVDHSSHSDIGLWEAVAAETIEGQNSVAWKQFRLGNLYAVKVYRYNPFWIEQFGSSGSLFPGTNEFLQAEENFEKDFDNNGLIGFAKIIDSTPKIKTATINDNLVRIQFDRELKEASLNPSRFQIQIDDRSIRIASLSLSASDGELILRLAENIDANDKVILSYTDLQDDQSQGVIESVDGFDLPNVINLELINLTADQLPPVLNKAVFKYDHIELQFSEQINDDIPLYSSFLVRNKDNNNVPLSSIEVDSKSALVKISLLENILPTDNLTISYNDLKGNQLINVLQDKDGNDVESFNSFPVAFENKEVPLNVFLITVDGTKLTLIFESDLAGTRPALSDFRVEADGKNLKISRFEIIKADRQIVLQLKKSVDPDQQITFSYFPPQNLNNPRVIKDINDNLLMPIISRAVLNDTQESLPLKLMSAELNEPNMIELIFNKELDNTIPSLSRFNIFHGKKRLKLQVIENNFKDGILNLKLKKDFISQDDLRLKYTDLIGNQQQKIVQDKSGNDLKSISKFRVNNYIVDEKPPEILDAEIISSSLLLSFDEKLLPRSINKNFFQVKNGNKRIKISSVDINPNQSTISIELRKKIMSKLDFVISYLDLPKDQKHGVVQDLSGNDLESFKDFDVIPIQKGSNQRIGHLVDSDFNVNLLVGDYSCLENDFCC